MAKDIADLLGWYSRPQQTNRPRVTKGMGPSFAWTIYAGGCEAMANEPV